MSESDTEGTDIYVNANPPQWILDSLFKKFQEGEHSLVFQQVQVLLSKYPNSLTLLNLFAKFSMGRGDYERAQDALSTIIKIKPDYAEAYFNKGVCFSKLNNQVLSEESFRHAILLKPNYIEAIINLGKLLAENAKVSEAEELYSEKLIYNTENKEYLVHVGLFYFRYKKYLESSKLLQNAIHHGEERSEIFRALSLGLKELGKLEEALTCIKAAYEKYPSDIHIINSTANIMIAAGHYSDAEEHIKRALSSWPEHPSLLINLGVAQIEQGQTDIALLTLTKALPFTPNSAELHKNIGICHMHKGEVAHAISSFETALGLNDQDVSVHRHLSLCKDYTGQEEHLQALHALARKQGLSQSEYCEIFYALFKALDDTKSYEDAFHYLLRANTLRKEMLSYDIRQDKILFENLIKIQKTLSKHSIQGELDECDVTPIFIFGMPRSGTSLVEQILGEHSSVNCGGELPVMQDIALNTLFNSEPINAATIKSARVKYLSCVAQLSEGRPFVTDKMPHNFRFMPLIKLLFPEAKLIHVSRERSATCWSNFSTYLDSKNLGYSHCLNDIAQYFSMYQKMIGTWQKIYPSEMIEISYDTLVETPELVIEGLLEDIGLNWEASCLTPHLSTRSVRTASNFQVKKKIYKTNSGKWKAYQRYIKFHYQEVAL